MAIHVKCACGKEVKARDDQAGVKVRCSSCRAMVRVPEEEYGVERVRKCPGCKREWPVKTVVCVDCGYNFESRRKLKTTIRVPDRVIDVGVVWLGCYVRYRFFRIGSEALGLNWSRKFFFIPLGNYNYNLKEYSAVLTDFVAGNDDGPDMLYLRLEGRGKRTVTIYSSPDEEKFKELVDLISQAGGLEVKRA
jgi:hypothetical protein